jgi:hypothetical protein
MLFKRYLCGLYIQPPSLGVLCTDLPIVELSAATKDTTRASTKDSIARREDIALQQSAKQHETVCCHCVLDTPTSAGPDRIYCSG